jgi:uncharacterized protein (DUF1499 family)
MMKILKCLLIFLVIGVVLLFVLRWHIERVSPRPYNLGVVNGRLTPCPASPNCVSTYATDAVYGIEAMGYDGETAVAQEKIIALIQATPNSTLITNEPGYIYAKFRSPMMGFIDDVEVYFDEETGFIQFRSASRLGHGDMNANRNRMEKIRNAYSG